MKNQSIFKKKELVLAVSVAMFSGVMTGCSSDSTSTAAAGSYTITAKGGNVGGVAGTITYGGNGGDITVHNEGGTSGVVVSARGEANTNFSSPIPKITVDTGTNPLEVAADTTVIVADTWTLENDLDATTYGGTYIGTDGILRTDSNFSSTADYANDAEVDDGSYYTDGNELYVADATVGADLAAAGTPYFYPEDDSIYAADGDAATADAAYTGISIAEDATLTLGLNFYGDARVSTDNDIENAGTITTTDNFSNRGDLDLRAYNYSASGTIDTSGNSTANYGGDVAISTAYAVMNSGDINTSGATSELGSAGYAGDIYIDTLGFIDNSGIINANGGDATSGAGYGGGVMSMYASYIENSGDINTNGGSGSTGYNGASADDIEMIAFFGVNNSGNLTANGGNGDDGGQAGKVALNTNSTGTTRNSGAITASSGDGNVGYAGGDNGESIVIKARGGDVINSGDLTTAGGSSVASTSSYYGSGGDIVIKTQQGDGATPPGDVIVSGNLNVNSGDISTPTTSNSAGTAGDITIKIQMDGSTDTPSSHPVSDQSITLLGYTDLYTNGGNGSYPGRGGDVNFFSQAVMDPNGILMAGPATNEANITTRSGDVDIVEGLTYGQGDDGGDVTIHTAQDQAVLITEAKVSNSGDIDTGGGNGYNQSSNSNNESGSVELLGYHGVDNSGAITANGGNDTAADGGEGGYGSNIELRAEMGPVVNSGAISNNGGDGEYDGGYSNGIDMYGTTVKNSGDLSSNGGNAVATLAGSVGGNGGYSYLWGLGLDVVSNSGALSYSGGTGMTEGNEGCFVVGLTLVGNCSGAEPR